MTLFLSRAEVEPLLDLRQAMEQTVAMLHEQARGATVAIPPRSAPLPEDELRIVTGALVDSERLLVRYVTPTRGDRSLALLFDLASGDLLSIMAYPFSILRTGATVGVATDLLAPADAATVGLLGTGRNALSLLQAACLTRPIERVRVYSRDRARREQFAARAAAALGVPVESAPDPRAATEGAAIVYAATDSPEPVIDATCVAPGALVVSMGQPSELAPSVYLAAGLVVVGNKRHEEASFRTSKSRHYLWELVNSGHLDWAALPELCELVADRPTEHTDPAQIVVFKESQGGIGDAALAGWVFAQAREQGLGREWELG
jgi:alanine dehydrogenase